MNKLVLFVILFNLGLVAVLRIENIPDVWTVDTISSIFDQLTNNLTVGSCATGKETLLGLFEVTQLVKADILNAVFNIQPKNCHDDNLDEEVNDDDDDDDEEDNPLRLFLKTFATVVTKAASTSSDGSGVSKANIFKTYKPIFGRQFNILSTNTARAGDLCRVLISWFSSYVVLNSYGKLYKEIVYAIFEFNMNEYF